MVRFSELNNMKPERGSASADTASGVGQRSSAPNAEGQAPADAPVDIQSLYEDACFYVAKIFAAVKERKRFALDPGFRIVRQIVESYCPGDPLFVQTIQTDDQRNYLVNKSVNVSIYATRLARQLGYSKETQAEIGMAGLLHEVGMSLVPKQIMYKKGQLTRKELGIMQQHSEAGYKILLSCSDRYPYLAEVALQIHERVDGSGYPHGLKADEIHEYAQIIGLVDTYEALSHSRPYRDRFDHLHVIKEIIKTCKTRFRKKHLKALVNAFSIFPLSTHVRLNSNAVGRVIETYPDQPMRPRVLIEYDSQGRKVLTERIVNLPDHSLLYIVDDKPEAPAEVLDLRMELPRQLEDHDEAAGGKDPVSPRSLPKASMSGWQKRRRNSRAESKPLLLFLPLLVLLVGFPYWQGRQTVGPSSASHRVTEGVRMAVQPESKELFAAVASPALPVKSSTPPPEPGRRQDADLKIKAPSSPPDSAQKTEPSPNDSMPALDQESIDSVVDQRPSIAEDPENGGFVNTGQEALPHEAGIQGAMPLFSSGSQAPFSILIGQYKSAAAAERAMAKHRGDGIFCYRVKVNLGNAGIWHRIFSGCFKTMQEAQQAADRIQVKEALVKRTRFAALVGSYPGREQAASEMQRLQVLGYSPYTIALENGGFDLFVGAFYTHKGAMEQRSELLAKGVGSRVVKR